jgi:Xaa-Pro aminopeptidase
MPIKEQEYKARREFLAKKLKKHSVAVVFSATQKTRSNDTNYPYRQNSNFYYLTGFTEENSTLIIVKKSKKIKTFLFVQEKDKSFELWNGKILGVKEAKKRFDVDDIFSSKELNKKLKELFEGTRSVYYDFKLDYSKVKVIKRYTKDISSYRNISLMIQKMRLVKSSSEIDIIKQALKITKEAHIKSIIASDKLDYEYQIQAEIEYIFKKNGAYSDAYTSIVASGDNANTLHYVTNNKHLKSGELILIDAGCEYQYYASDITRTIPKNKKFSKPQKDLYSLVLFVEKEIISMIKPGIYRSDLQKRAEELLCKGMIKLGILKGNYKQLIKNSIHKKYFPHGIGHWMGLDVHDEAPYKTKKLKEIPLKKGMVLTIEPGIYCPSDDKSIPKKYRGIGIRIEDNILVSADGYENLSFDIPKEIDEIEAIGCKSSSNQ